MNRRGFLALLGLSPLAANLAARAASEATIVGIDGGADDGLCMVFRTRSEQQRLGFFESNLPRGRRILRGISEPPKDMSIAEMLGIERRPIRSDHIPELCQPAGLESLVQDDGSEVPRGDGIDLERIGAAIFPAQPHDDAGGRGCGGEAQDIGQAGGVLDPR
jgi:hypothetical protein